MPYHIAPFVVPPAVIRKRQHTFNGEDLLQKPEFGNEKDTGQAYFDDIPGPHVTLNPVFTVGEQIIRVFRNNKRISRKEAEKEALGMIEMVKLPDAKNIMGKYPHELSGGQRQRIVIAIALSCGAEFLIADEPTRNLDVTIQAGILKLIAELQRELGVTVLFIANNLGLVSTICKRVAILNAGRSGDGQCKGSTEGPKAPVYPYPVKCHTEEQGRKGEPGKYHYKRRKRQGPKGMQVLFPVRGKAGSMP